VVDRVFDVDIERAIEVEALAWPERGGAQDESCLGCNRSYFDLRGVGWRAVSEMIVTERRVMRQLQTAPDMVAAYENLKEQWEEDCEFPLWGLDLGVASAVVALSAARCIPFTSCNAGAFGDGPHPESYPLVAFYMRRATAQLIIDSASSTCVGLHQDSYGTVHVYARTVSDLHKFAEALYARRTEIRAVRLREPSGKLKNQDALDL
jgi:hypothetical protein